MLEKWAYNLKGYFWNLFVYGENNIQFPLSWEGTFSQREIEKVS